MHGQEGDYGLWLLVFVNSAIFIFFAFSFFQAVNEKGIGAHLARFLRSLSHFVEGS